MKTQIFSNMSVVYNVPDSVKIADGKVLDAHVTLSENDCKVDITKTEPTVRRKSNITHLSGGNNTTTSYNADDDSGRMYITLRPNEDWRNMESDVMEQVKTAYQKLLEISHK